MRNLLFLCLAIQAVAGEYVVLRTGFRIHADRHEAESGILRLYTQEGVIQLPAASVTSIEAEDHQPPAPALEPPPQPEALPTPSAHELVERAARRHGLPPELLHSVAMVESACRPDALSPKGAIGIMQLMPGTAAELNADPANPEQNVDAGARLLRQLLLKYDRGAWRALAAYNAGPGAVERYNGVPPYRETRLYVERVLNLYKRLSERHR